jgi:hypothetical protein
MPHELLVSVIAHVESRSRTPTDRHTTTTQIAPNSGVQQGVHLVMKRGTGAAERAESSLPVLVGRQPPGRPVLALIILTAARLCPEPANVLESRMLAQTCALGISSRRGATGIPTSNSLKRSPPSHTHG